ncbi:MAG: tyrosine-type recombinase/integrase [Cyclobacteriaceae bacterium]
MKNLPLNTYAYRELELDFKEWLALLGYAENTVYNMPLYMHEFFHWLESEEVKKVREITAQHVHDFIFQLKKRPHAKHGGKLSTGHINKYHQALVLLSQFVRQTDRGSFTVETERLPEKRHVPDILTTAEVKELYKATDGSVLGLRDKVMLGIFYGCGLRRNEGVQLDVSDIDFNSQLVYVRKGKNYKERYVPAGETTLQHIKDYLDHSRPFLMTRNKIPALLVSDKGYRIRGQSLLIRLRRLARLSKIEKDIGLHTLRHSIATHLLQSGMKLAHIAKFLGHRSLEATQIYTHVIHEKL